VTIDLESGSQQSIIGSTWTPNLASFDTSEKDWRWPRVSVALRIVVARSDLCTRTLLKDVL
jgi:hypothetical protein